MQWVHANNFGPYFVNSFSLFQCWIGIRISRLMLVPPWFLFFVFFFVWPDQEELGVWHLESFRRMEKWIRVIGAGIQTCCGCFIRRCWIFLMFLKSSLITLIWKESMGRDHTPFNFDAISIHHLLILLLTFFFLKCNERWSVKRLSRRSVLIEKTTSLRLFFYEHYSHLQTL